MNSITKIDLDNWNRIQHYNFFKSVPYPIYNICFDIKIDRLIEFSRDKKISMNLSMIYIVTKAINSIENFRYRVRGDDVILHDFLTPSYTDIDEGSELFKMVTVELREQIIDFAQKAKQKAKAQTEYFIINDFANRDDFVFYSIIPWINFTSIDHTINLKQNDAIPRVTIGKYFSKNTETFLPFNIQVNHLFVDGIHLGKLKENIDYEIKMLN